MHSDVGRTGTLHEAVEPSPVKLSVRGDAVCNAEPYVNEGRAVNQGRPDFLLELVEARYLEKVKRDPALIEKKTERKVSLQASFKG